MSQKTETVVEEIQPTEDKESLSKENKEVKRMQKLANLIK